MNSVYERPPESTKLANPFDTRPTDTSYLTPAGVPHLPHLSSSTVKQKFPKKLDDVILSLVRKSTKEINKSSFHPGKMDHLTESQNLQLNSLGRIYLQKFCQTNEDIKTPYLLHMIVTPLIKGQA